MTFQYFNIGPILTGRGLWLIAFWAWFQAPRSTLGPEAQQPTCSCSEVPRTFFDGGPVLGRLAAGEFQAKVKEHSELIESYQPLGRCYGPREPYACPYQDRLVIPPGCFNVNPTMIIQEWMCEWSPPTSMNWEFPKDLAWHNASLFANVSSVQDCLRDCNGWYPKDVKNGRCLPSFQVGNIVTPGFYSRGVLS